MNAPLSPNAKMVQALWSDFQSSNTAVFLTFLAAPTILAVSSMKMQLDLMRALLDSRKR